MIDLNKAVSRFKLTGTPEQVKWATSIRKKKCEELQKMRKEELALYFRTRILDSHLEQLHVDTPKKAMQMITGICVHSLSCPDSKWWISNRDSKQYKQLLISWPICFEHWKQTQPFK